VTAVEDIPVAAHSWMPLDLLAIESGPSTPPTIGGLVYSGRKHVFSGEPETLKTWAALVLCVEQVRAGENVIYVDFEMDGREQLARLRDLGLDDDEVRRFCYIAPAEPLTNTKGRPFPHLQGDIDALLTDRPPSLVVFDAFTGALEIHGFDPNSGVEVERFYRTVVKLFQMCGAGVVVLDHLTKNRDTRGRYSIGSERKLGAADVHLGFELIRSFGRGRSGLAKIVTHKDRPGHLPRPKAAEFRLASDPVTGIVSWEICLGESIGADAPFRPTHLMEKVSRYVASHVDERPSRNAVEKNVGGKAEYVRKAIDVLIKEGFLEPTAGMRNAKLLRSLKPYREDEDDAA
jgi:hypothetical protein